jgi:hypothetical protein
MDPRDASKTSAPREPVTEPAALPWGMDQSGVQKSSLTALTDEKLARFVIGQQKKTKYEKVRIFFFNGKAAMLVPAVPHREWLNRSERSAN